MIEMLSLDLSNYCSKGCSFCYNHSNSVGVTMWRSGEAIAFLKDCVAHGVKAVSLGGGEPFEYDGIFQIIEALYPLCYISVTSNGLPLENEDVWQKLTVSKPDKIHLTIHHPEDNVEVERVLHSLIRIRHIGIKPGINILVSSDKITEARNTYSKAIHYIKPEQIILVPQRFSKTPTPSQLSEVSGGWPFQSPSCLLKCQPKTDFVSVSWDKKVNFCSFAKGKEPLQSLNYPSLCEAISRIKFESCLVNEQQ